MCLDRCSASGVAVLRSLTPLFLLIALIVPVSGWAGPWSREPGRVFLSFSTERDRSDNAYSSLYTEYGLGPRTTLGMEAGHTEDESTVLLWGQRSFGRPDACDHWTMSLGLGAVQRGGRTRPMGMLGTAWGRGFDALPLLRRVPGGGWLSVETRVKFAPTLPPENSERAAPAAYRMADITSKADVTLGWHATPALMLIGQLRLDYRESPGLSSRVAVSAVHDLGRKAKLDAGVVAPLSSGGGAALHLGTWLEF